MSTSGSRQTAPPPYPASGTGRRATVGDGEGVKVAKPDLYYGDRNKLDEWLTQLDLFFQFQGGDVPANRRVLFATTYMRDRAHKWIRPYQKKYLEQDNDNEDLEAITQWMESYPRFRTKIKSVFGISNETPKAVRIIQHLRQRGSAAEYAAEFEQHSALTGWDDDALMTMFRRGLKTKIKDELARTGASIETLHELTQEAIRIDDTWYERYLEDKYDRNQAPIYAKGGARYDTSQTSARNGNNRGTYLGPMPMELDAITKGKPSKGKGKGKGKVGLKKKGNCYTCGKPGHYARNCRSGRMPQQQLNVLDREPTPYTVDRNEEDDEWNDDWEQVFPQEEESDTLSDHRDEQQQPASTPELTEDEDPDDGIVLGSNGEVWQFQPSRPSRPPSRVLQLGNEVANRSRERLNRVLALLDTDQRSFRGQGLSAQERHEDLHWSACYDDHCGTHRSAKDAAGWHPSIPWWEGHCRKDDWDTCYDDQCFTHLSQKLTYRWFPREPNEPCEKDNWENCNHKHCITHLYAKKRYQKFPGVEGYQTEILRRQTYEHCFQHCWALCEAPRCFEHWKKKQAAGFIPKN